MASQNTRNRSERNINKHFSLVEFNNEFEKDNIYLKDKDNKFIFKGIKLNKYIFIINIFIMIGILLLFYSIFFLK